MIDATALAAVADELSEKCVPGRVQQVVQLDPFSVGFEVYARQERRYIMASVRPEDARIHLVAEKLRASGEPPSPLALVLRKYAQDAWVERVTQVAHERVLKIQFDHATEGVTTLVVETMGRYSNLVLVDAGGQVIDALKRIGPQINRARVTLPRQPYALPPPQEKLEPEGLTTAALAHLLAADRGLPLWRVLVGRVAGVSPLLAREIAFRVAKVTGLLTEQAQADPNSAEQVIRILMALVRGPWEPCVAYEEGEPDEVQEPAAFAPYRLTQYSTTRPFGSISAAIEAFYGALDSYSTAKEPLRAQLAEAHDRLARKRDSLARSVPADQEIERTREQGEWILALASRIQPGAQVLNAEPEAGVSAIKLDPTLTPVENAQRYFKEYRRLKDAAERVPPLLEAATAELDYAEQLLNDLDLAENRAELDAVFEAAHAAGWIRRARTRAKVLPSEPRAFTSRDGFSILVGKNARQNEEVTFHRARADDLWLHSRNSAGAHVVIMRGGREIPESTILEAARLAAQYSQARTDSFVDVIVTERKHVRRARGGRTGMVTVRASRTVRVGM